MQALDHTFPLPETEVHKLDDLQHAIDENPGSMMRAASAFVQSNRWWLLAVGGLAGIAATWFWRRKH